MALPLACGYNERAALECVVVGVGWSGPSSRAWLLSAASSHNDDASYPVSIGSESPNFTVGMWKHAHVTQPLAGSLPTNRSPPGVGGDRRMRGRGSAAGDVVEKDNAARTAVHTHTHAHTLAVDGMCDTQ